MLVPTRGRPDSVRRLMESAEATADGMLEWVFYMDRDDDTVRELRSELQGRDWTTVIVGDRILLSEMWNRCHQAAASDIYWHGNDDIVFRTPGWDARVAAAFEESHDRILFVHGDDGDPTHRGVYGAHGFLHRNWIDAVGYFVPPYFSSDFNDTWLNEVADMIGRRRFVDVYIEHMHPAFGKAEIDQTFRERLERHASDDCNAIYERTADLRRVDAEKLQGSIDGYWQMMDADV